MPFVLTINGGSSSVKYALFEFGAALERKSAGSMRCSHSHGAAEGVLEWLKPLAALENIAAIGHRIVHGGPKYVEHALIKSAMLDELRRISPIDPDHLPGEIALIEEFNRRCPNIPQVACFDTAFHCDLPQIARTLPIPRRYADAGVRRFGFHGLSYSYLMEELARQAGAEAAKGRVILAHLGSGASMAAVQHGKCTDTTMAFTPTAGLVMGTRTGDLDPGVLIYLIRQEKLTADQLDELINKRSGLLGVSGISSDMRDLMAKCATSPAAAEAIDLFCYQARKWIGALAAALGGVETLVFSGGIGENSPEVRSHICRKLEHLGIQVDDSRNQDNAAVISSEVSRVTVRVIPTDEELMIARITLQNVLASDTRKR